MDLGRPCYGSTKEDKMKALLHDSEEDAFLLIDVCEMTYRRGDRELCVSSPLDDYIISDMSEATAMGLLSALYENERINLIQFDAYREEP